MQNCNCLGEKVALPGFTRVQWSTLLLNTDGISCSVRIEQCVKIPRIWQYSDGSILIFMNCELIQFVAVLE